MQKFSKGTDYLGRYYTRDYISSVLVGLVENEMPGNVLDLGSGDGALSTAALARWDESKVFSVDIDCSLISKSRHLKLLSLEGRYKHIIADALSHDLPSFIDPSISKLDIAVCNPPFIIPEWKKEFGEILEDAGFSGCLPVISNIDAAFIFLAQNLRLLSENGSLSIILPDSLISSHKYKGFRKELLDQYRVRKVVKLPRGSFQRTEALASIVVIEKARPFDIFIPITKISNGKEILNSVQVPLDRAVDRLDYDFHVFEKIRIENHSKNSISLGDSGAEIKRGILSSKQAKLSSFPVLHTTDLLADKYGKWCDLSSYTSSEPVNLLKAHPGDILIGRVGRNLEMKVIGVEKGNPIITDCLYILRVSEKLRRKALVSLTSDYGKKWLASRAYGVAARHLSKKDLMEFTLISD